MSIYYLDLTGKRPWQELSDVQSILERKDNDLVSEDVLFIHASDFVPPKRIYGIEEIDVETKTTFKSLIEKWINSGKIGDGEANIQFFSGGQISLSKKKQIVEKLHKHNQSKIYYYFEKIDRGSNPQSMVNNIIARFFKEPTDVSSINNKDDYELLISFRIAWQIYVLQRTSKNNVPSKFSSVKEKIEDVSFDKEYWAPFLSGGKLKQYLVDHMTEDLQPIKDFLISYAFGNPAPEEALRSYRNRWFKNT